MPLPPKGQTFSNAPCVQTSTVGHTVAFSKEFHVLYFHLSETPAGGCRENFPAWVPAQQRAQWETARLRVRRSLRDRVGEGPSVGGGLKSGKGPREKTVSPLTGSARKLVQGPTQVDGELIRPWLRVLGGGGDSLMNGNPPTSPGREVCRKRPASLGPDRTRCLVRRRATFPPQVGGIRRGAGKGTARRENRSHHPEFVPNLSQSRATEQTV